MLKGGTFMKYGDRLKQLRNEKKLSQQELADKLGINRSTYARYETSATQPDYETLQKLADFFDVSIDYLLGRTDNPTTSNNHRLELTEKDEMDVAKRLQKFKEEIEKSDGLAFSGEPLSEEAKESLIESMEYIFRQTQKINKKYIPKKFRDEE